MAWPLHIAYGVLGLNSFVVQAETVTLDGTLNALQSGRSVQRVLNNVRVTVCGGCLVHSVCV